MYLLRPAAATLVLAALVLVSACGSEEKAGAGYGAITKVFPDARLDEERKRIVITEDQGNLRGSAWNPTPFDLSNDLDLSITIYLGSKDPNGADGLAFVFAEKPSEAAVGCGLGYAGLSGTSLAVELDTYRNAVYPGVLGCPEIDDPDVDHVAIDEDGDVKHSGARPLVPLDADLEDGKEHTLRVRWAASAKRLTVSIDGRDVLTYERDLAQKFGGKPVVYGITGSTGALSNLQYVR